MNTKKKNPYILTRNFNFFNEAISPRDIDVQINEPKDSLNKEIWEGEKLKKDVRLAMLKIAKAFKEYLKLNCKLKDVIFTGSLANYNWTLMSDIDIHLILDLESMNEPLEFLQEYIVAKKTLWNDEHDIKIKGFEVELFAKDEETLFSSKGVYSILKDAWIQKAEKYTKEIDEIAIKEKAATIINDIDSLEQIDDNEELLEKAEKINEKIKKLRNSGLEQGGEYSVENLVFKLIRKAEYLQKLWDIKQKAFDSSLSLAEKTTVTESVKKQKTLITEDKKGFKKEYGCLMLDLNIKNWNEITDRVREEDVYDMPGFGKEDKPHITALFGFISSEVTPEEIEKATKEIAGNKKLKVRLTNLSLFEGKKYDVLKFEVTSPDLQKLNAALREKFPYKNEHPDYQPHMTVAYLQPGMGKKYAKKFKKHIVFESGNFTYSYPPNEKAHFNLNENILGVEEGIEGMTPEKVEIIKTPALGFLFCDTIKWYEKIKKNRIRCWIDCNSRIGYLLCCFS